MHGKVQVRGRAAGVSARPNGSQARTAGYTLTPGKSGSPRVQVRVVRQDTFAHHVHDFPAEPIPSFEDHHARRGRAHRSTRGREQIDALVFPPPTAPRAETRRHLRSRKSHDRHRESRLEVRAKRKPRGEHKKRNHTRHSEDPDSFSHHRHRLKPAATTHNATNPDFPIARPQRMHLAGLRAEPCRADGVVSNAASIRLPYAGRGE